MPQPLSPQPVMPHDPTIMTLLEHSSLAPILNTPASAVLKDLGLGPLPPMPMAVPPMPGLPPLPIPNLEQLFKPLTDMFGSFGTGNLGDGGFDPTAIFQQLETVLNTAMSMSNGGLQVMSQVWQGMAGTSSGVKTAEQAGNAGALAGQSAGIQGNTTSAAAIVGTGATLMAQNIAKFFAVASAFIPVIVTPAGQAGVMTALAEAMTEGTAIIAATKAQLADPTGVMIVNGQHIPVTGIPSGTPNPFGIASTVMQGVQTPLSSAMQAGSQLAGSLHQQIAAQQTAAKLHYPGKGDPKLKGGGAKPGGGGGGGGKLGGGGGAGLGGMPTPLSTRPNPTLPQSAGPAEETVQAENAATTTETTTTSGMMPMSGAGAMGAGRNASASDSSGHGAPSYLVTGEHGAEVVGEMPMVAQPVIGGEQKVEDDVESVDQALRIT